MLITVIVRTRNEERNIARYCKAYSWADKILIADGGSTDHTKEIASTFPNVEIRDFTLRKNMDNNLWRNPEAEHLNFLVDWAKEYNPDWIVQDDCDCVPNMYLQRDARRLLEFTSYQQAYVLRIFLWRGGTHYPMMAQPTTKGIWQTSMWAWKPSTVDMKFTNSEMAFEFTPLAEIEDRLEVTVPYCDLHYTWADDDLMLPKLQFYRDSGQIPTCKHPTEFAGDPEPIPVWAILE